MNTNLIKTVREIKRQTRLHSENTSHSIVDIEKRYMSQIRDIENQISELKRKKYQLESICDDEQKLVQTAFDNYVEQQKPILEKYKRIIDLLLLSKSNPSYYPTINEPNNRGKFVELIDEPIKNKHINVKVFIFENDNRTNCYTLGIVGLSIFNYTTLRMKLEYGFKPYFSGQTMTFDGIIKTGKTKKELIEYYNKKGIDKLIDVMLINNTILEYETVIEDCNTIEWELEVLQHQKQYYENSVSHGTDTTEYKDILVSISKLSDKL